MPRAPQRPTASTEEIFNIAEDNESEFSGPACSPSHDTSPTIEDQYDVNWLDINRQKMNDEAWHRFKVPGDHSVHWWWNARNDEWFLEADMKSGWTKHIDSETGCMCWHYHGCFRFFENSGTEIPMSPENDRWYRFTLPGGHCCWWSNEYQKKWFIEDDTQSGWVKFLDDRTQYLWWYHREGDWFYANTGTQQPFDLEEVD